MKRVIHNLAQGSAEWHSYRAKHFNASDAAAMLGISQYKTRNQLLKEKATGLTEDIDAGTQKRFDDGHRYEEMVRPLVEELLGEELSPIIASLEIDGLPLSASYDGVTIGEDQIYEHKTSNARLRDALLQQEIPAEYHPQLEQQLLVIGAKRVIFCASNGTQESLLWVAYESNPELRAEIIAGWKQFKADLDAYQVVEVKPAAVAATIKQLPALMVNLVGEVTSTNLAVYEETALSFIKAINTDLRTDQDFADAEAMVKFCDGAEKELETVKKMALAQTSTIDELFRTIDGLKEQMRSKRLELDKLVKSRKDTIKGEIIQRGQRTVAEHIANLNTRLGKPYMPHTQMADFIGVTKGKRTVDSFNEAVDLEIARVKIAANEIADRIQGNMGALSPFLADYPGLFPDAAQIVNKSHDDFLNLINSRITAQKAKEQERIAAEAKRLADEAERQRVAAEIKQQAELRIAAMAALPPVAQKAEQKEPSPVFTQRAPVVTPLPAMTCDMLISRITARLKTMSVSELAEVDAFVQSIHARS